MDKITLRKALQQGRIDQFIAEHEGDIGDADALERTILSMAGTSKEAQEASSADDCDD